MHLDPAPLLRIFLWPLLLASVVSSASCQDESTAVLPSGMYLLESSEGFEPDPYTGIILWFTEELVFNAGCQSQSGKFSVADGRLIVNEVTPITLGCYEPRRAQSQWMTDFITSRPQLKQEGDRITLVGATATLVFLDRDADIPLVGTPWNIDAFIEDDRASTVELDQPATLTFRDDGEMEVFTGCTSGSGQYKLDDTRLTLAKVIYSEPACSEIVNWWDTQVRTVMREGELSIELRGPYLTLRRIDGTRLTASSL